MWRDKFRQILLDEFDSRREKNPRFSLRAFAKMMEVSAGTVSEILRDKEGWSVSQDRALAMLQRLTGSTDHLQAVMGMTPPKSKVALSSGDFDTLTKWTYYPVLMAFDLEEPHMRPEAIAHRLGIPKAEVDQIIEDLLARGLLERTSIGTVRRKEGFWESPTEIPTPVIRQHHRDNIQLSLRALEEIPPPEREISSLTFAGNKEQFENLRQEIIAFQDRLTALMKPGTGNEVYRMSVQLFPVNFSARSK